MMARALRGAAITLSATAMMFAVSPGWAAPVAAAPAVPPVAPAPGRAAKPAHAGTTAQMKKTTKNQHTPGNRPTRVAVVNGVPVVHAIHSYQRGSLTGTVTNERGAVVPGAVVRLVSVGSHHRNHHVHPFFATATDVKGSFKLILIRARHYQVSVGKRNVGHAERHVHVGAGLPTHVNMVLHPAAKHHRHRRHR